jgi:hypothetical protein
MMISVLLLLQPFGDVYVCSDDVEEPAMLMPWWHIKASVITEEQKAAPVGRFFKNFLF